MMWYTILIDFKIQYYQHITVSKLIYGFNTILMKFSTKFFVIINKPNLKLYGNKLDQGDGGMEHDSHWVLGSFWGDESALKLIFVMVAQIC